MGDEEKNPSKKLLLKADLEGFFYQHLKIINGRYIRPLPEETIVYSSKVLGQYGESHQFFETIEGKVRNKILGTKLLESAHFNPAKQKRVFKEVGDTALFLCGFFAESLNKKIIDIGYYEDLGVSAYQRLNSLIPNLYDFPSFYEDLSKNFKIATTLISQISSNFNNIYKENHHSDNFYNLVFDEDSKNKKVS